MTRRRRRPRLVRQGLALVAMVAVTAGCRSYDGPPESSSGRAAGATTQSTTAGDAASTTTSTGPAASTTSSSTAARSGTTAAPPTTRPPGDTPSGAAVTFARPGTYRYATTGQFSSTIGVAQPRDGEATLTVDPVAGTDQHSFRQGPGRSTEQVLRLSGGSTYLVSLRLAEQGLSKEIRPDPPALAMPGDAAPGRTWSWSAPSTDGRTQVESQFRAVREESVAVGSSQVQALVVEVLLKTTGDITVTSTQTLWVSRRHGLVVRQDDNTQGRLGAITFTTTSSDRLLSLDPT